MAKMSAERIAEISQRFGFTVEQTVKDAEQANETDGFQCNGVSWATDSKGVYDAEKLFRGFLEKKVSERRADSLSHDEFCQNAYGD